MTAAEAQGRTEVLRDGSATLSPADLLVVLGALHTAARLGDVLGERAADIAAYRRLSRSLGDDR